MQIIDLALVVSWWSSDFRDRGIVAPVRNPPLSLLTGFCQLGVVRVKVLRSLLLLAFITSCKGF